MVNGKMDKGKDELYLEVIQKLKKLKNNFSQ